MIHLKLKRIYEPADETDGERFLVERLWPRGVSKERARLALWLKDVAPSPELRTWYSHDSEKWEEFRLRYLAELERKSEDLDPVRKAARSGPVTLVFAARDAERSSARVLADFLRGEEEHGGD